MIRWSFILFLRRTFILFILFDYWVYTLKRKSSLILVLWLSWLSQIVNYLLCQIGLKVFLDQGSLLMMTVQIWPAFAKELAISERVVVVILVRLVAEIRFHFLFKWFVFLSSRVRVTLRMLSSKSSSKLRLNWETFFINQLLLITSSSFFCCCE